MLETVQGATQTAVGYGCYVRTENQLFVMTLLSLLEDLLLEHLAFGKDVTVTCYCCPD